MVATRDTLRAWIQGLDDTNDKLCRGVRRSATVSRRVERRLDEVERRLRLRRFDVRRREDDRNDGRIGRGIDVKNASDAVLLRDEHPVMVMMRKRAGDNCDREVEQQQTSGENALAHRDLARRCEPSASRNRAVFHHFVALPAHTSIIYTPAAHCNHALLATSLNRDPAVITRAHQWFQNE